MKLFGFNKKNKKSRLQITEPDRNWVEDSFRWLIQVYGYPQRQNSQILVSKKYFPKTFHVESIQIRALIEDLSLLLNLDAQRISFEFHEDLRDTYGTPYEVQGKPFEVETEALDKNYKLHIAKNLTQHPNRLIFSLIYEFIRIGLIESELEYDTGDDTSLFIYIAGIYFGFGLILTQNLTDTGRNDDGFWETKWNYISEMPDEVMVFGLASYSKLFQEDNPDWKQELPEFYKSLFDSAISLLNTEPSDLLNKAELSANDLFTESYKHYQNQEFESAISLLRKILSLTDDELLKCDVYNNIGYYLMRQGNHKESISNFQKAIEFDSNSGFAYDNLGYALIKTNQLEEGKNSLDQALRTGNNDPAYSHRNLALYHKAKDEVENAKKHFELSFNLESNPVDLLDFHYAEFLISIGERQKGLKHLNKAIMKKEQEAIEFMSDLENPNIKE